MLFRSLKGLPGPQINGSVRSLLLYKDQLYVGGEFSIPGTNTNGLAIYDLANQRWDVNGIQPLQSKPADRVTVRSITQSSSKPDTIVVAGSFAQAGALSCQSICAFDAVSKQWNALAQGIQGDVASVAYAGVSLLAHCDSVGLIFVYRKIKNCLLQQGPSHYLTIQYRTSYSSAFQT